LLKSSLVKVLVPALNAVLVAKGATKALNAGEKL
jgi:hypothetical protein